MDIDLAKVRLVDGVALRHGQVAVGIVADDRAGLVVLVEAVGFDDVDQPVGILGVGGVARTLQSVGPSLVVGLVQSEEALVVGPVGKKLAMVLVALQGRIIDAEQLAPAVVVMAHGPTSPAVALDAKVVVALRGKLARAGSALQQPLGQGDAGRDAVFVHLDDGDVLVSVDVVLPSLVPSDLSLEGQTESYQQEKRE